MKTIVIIFGGRSVEHDISVLTALHAAKHVENYNVRFVYLTRDNCFLTGDVLGDIDWYIEKRGKGAKSCWFAEGALWVKGFVGARRVEVEAVLNCCHGGVGENGALAAMMSVAGVPIISCDMQAAQDTQSKSRTREILTTAGFIQPKFISICAGQECPKDVFEKLGSKVIVKPDTLGSSIGISVATNEEELRSALELSFGMDKKVIVEEYIENMREINCSAFRWGGEVRASECEVLESDRAILDFEKKYLEKTHGGVKKSREAAEESNESNEVFGKIQNLTMQAYELFGCSGVVRADFMVVGEKMYLTEINTVPGFLAYHLWARKGLPYGVLIDALIKQARADFTSNNRLNHVFKSNILEANRELVK